MGVSFFIASRLKFGGKIAGICIAVSFFVMIIAVAVSSGFRREIRDGLSAVSGDVQIAPVDINFLSEDSYMERRPAYIEHLEALDGVSEIVPVIYRAGIVRNGDNIQGVMIKGIPSAEDGAEDGEDDGLGVSIPSRLASMLALEEGDGMTTYFVGDRVKVRKFRVESVYDGIAGSDDRLVVFAGIEALQRLNGWDEDMVSALEIRLSDEMRTVRGMEYMEGETGFAAYAYGDEDETSVTASSAVRMYPQLFDWLGLIDFNVLFILVLMTIVAGFNMISGLLIMLFEHISTIGLLKAVGMTDRAIAKVFLLRASSSVLKGMAVGNAAALAFCVFQACTHAIRLDPANYFVSFVPVHADIFAILAADAISYAVIMALLVIPCAFISRVDPARTLVVK